MPTYNPITDFSVKDGLTTGDPDKLVRGSEIDAELAAISTAIGQAQDDVGTNVANGLLLLDANARYAQAQQLLNPELETLVLDGVSAPTITQKLSMDAERLAWELQDSSASDASRWRWLTEADDDLRLDRGLGAAGAETFQRVLTVQSSDARINFAFTPTVLGTEVVLESASLTAGTGISVSGDFSTGVTVAARLLATGGLTDFGGQLLVNPAPMAVAPAVDPAADFIIISDTSVGFPYKALIDDVLGPNETGTFTPTWGGFSVAPTTAAITYERYGNVVVLSFQFNRYGTSNSTSFSLSGLPASIRPGATVRTQYVDCLDNGTNEVMAYATVSSGGVMNFLARNSFTNAASTNWTASGSKGIIGSTQIIYSLEQGT